jgi:hypothetical protein
MITKMKKTGLASLAAGIFGCMLAIFPWLYIDNPGLDALFSTCLGAIFVGIARADLLSDLLRKGNPGDEVLKDSCAAGKSAASKFMHRLHSDKKS